MVRCLVTGAGGFVGGYLMRELIRAGHDLVATVQNEEQRAALDFGGEIHVLDICNAAQTRSVIETCLPEAVFHLAALTFVPQVEAHRDRAVAINVGGTLNLLHALGEVKPDARVLFTSSAHVYAPSSRPLRESDPLAPSSFYGVTKQLAESLCDFYRRGGMTIIAARAFNHIGPGQDESFVLSSFARQIAEIERGSEPVLRVGNLSAMRDFTDVRDVVRAYRLLVESRVPAGIYNVASGQGISIDDLLQQLRSLSSSEIRVEIDPDRFRPGDQSRVIGDASALKAVTSWEPEVPIADSLGEILDGARALA